METITHSTLAMLAVINPFVCGAMLLQIERGKDKKDSIIAGVKAMIIVLIILLVSALAGKYILSAFGISMDAFKVVGGIILTYIGFNMFSVPKTNNNPDVSSGITKLVMFAASPGTISMVITLAIVHNKDGLPVSAMAGSTLAVALTIVIIILMLLLKKKKSTGGQGMMSKFMGLIIVAMGLQFMLDGIKHFFGL
jgi:multiple antibiotic resistance protein